MKTTITVSAVISFVVGMIFNILFITNTYEYNTKLLMFFIVLSVSGISKLIMDLNLNSLKISIQNEYSLKMSFSNNKTEDYLVEQEEEYNLTMKELEEVTKYTNRLSMAFSLITIVVLYFVVNG